MILKAAFSYRALASSANACKRKKEKRKLSFLKITNKNGKDVIKKTTDLGKTLGCAGLSAEEDGDLPLPVLHLRLRLLLRQQRLGGLLRPGGGGAAPDEGGDEADKESGGGEEEEEVPVTVGGSGSGEGEE